MGMDGAALRDGSSFNFTPDSLTVDGGSEGSTVGWIGDGLETDWGWSEAGTGACLGPWGAVALKRGCVSAVWPCFGPDGPVCPGVGESRACIIPSGVPAIATPQFHAGQCRGTGKPCGTR